MDTIKLNSIHGLFSYLLIISAFMDTVSDRMTRDGGTNGFNESMRSGFRAPGAFSISF